MVAMKLRKRDGTEEPIRRGKIERSIRDTGTSSQNAKKISDSIQARDGMTTNDIRKLVSSRLREMDPKSADTYDKQRRLTVHQSNDQNSGKILLDNATLKDLGLKPGDSLSVVLSTIRDFEVGKSEQMELGAFINNEDIRSLKFNEGHRIIIRRK